MTIFPSSCRNMGLRMTFVFTVLQTLVFKPLSRTGIFPPRLAQAAAAKRPPEPTGDKAFLGYNPIVLCVLVRLRCSIFDCRAETSAPQTAGPRLNPPDDPTWRIHVGPSHGRPHRQRQVARYDRHRSRSVGGELYEDKAPINGWRTSLVSRAERGLGKKAPSGLKRRFMTARFFTAWSKVS